MNIRNRLIKDYKRFFDLSELDENDNLTIDWADLFISKHQQKICAHPFDKVHQSDTECFCTVCGFDLT